jgi:hypothetical protein
MLPRGGARYYFFFPDPMVGCQPDAAPFWLWAAAIVLIFSFFGFLDSRLPFCSPLACRSLLLVDDKQASMLPDLVSYRNGFSYIVS